MSTPDQPNSLNALSDSLGAEYDQSRAAQREQVIAELKQVIDQVPEQIEFTNTPRFKVWGPILLLVSLAIAFGGMKTGSAGLTWLGVIMAVLFGVMSWQHRTAGTQVFMRLNRRQLWVDSLSAPVEMADVEDISVKDEGQVMQQKLDLSSEAALPTHRAAQLKLFGNQAMALKKPRPHIRIMSAGIMTAGRRVHVDEMGAILAAYRDAARAQRQLDLLLRQG